MDDLAEFRQLLQNYGYEILIPAAAARWTETHHGQFTFVLVDLASVCEESALRVAALRVMYAKPIICLLPTPHEGHVEQIARIPADTVIFKPVRPEELTSQLGILRWRSNPGNVFPMVERRRHRRAPGGHIQDNAPTLEPNLALQINAQGKFVVYNGRRIRLTPKEYMLLTLLASEPGRIFSNAEIIAWTWHGTRRATSNDVHQCVFSLRRKIEADAAKPRLIKTVHSFGYQLAKPNDE